MERCGLFYLVVARIERMESKRGNGGTLVIVALFVLILVGSYVAGYFCLSEEAKFVAANGSKQEVIPRHFKSSLACWAYKPAARVEGRARGIPVKLWHTDPFE